MKKGFLTALAFLYFYFSHAQDTHYWTQQFGTRSALLGGAVVAGSADNSMIFYNPGALAFLDSSSVSVNATLYQVENTRINNIVGGERDFSTLQISSVPLLSSGQFRARNTRIRLGYGIFTPVAFQFRGIANREGNFPVTSDADSPGNELSISDQNLFIRLRELDVSFGGAYKINENWAIGVTNIFTIRSHNYNQAIFTRFFLNNSTNTLVTNSLTQSFNYYNVRAIPKLGIAYRSGPWSVGVALTAPSINMFGTGTVAVDAVGNNVKLNNSRTDVVVTGRERRIKSLFQSPYSVAAGLQLKVKATTFAVSTQYFGAQDIYPILKAQTTPLVRSTSGAGVPNSSGVLQVITAAKPVINVAFGLEHGLTERTSFIASLRTNQTYYNPDVLNVPGIKPDVSTWNIYHATAGVTMRRPRSSMSLGFTAKFGRDNARPQEYSLASPAETPFFQNNVALTQATYNGIGIILGYNFFFKKG